MASMTQTLTTLKDASKSIVFPSTLSSAERMQLKSQDPVEYARCALIHPSQSKIACTTACRTTMDAR
jgi:hypothetical protein